MRKEIVLGQRDLRRIPQFMAFTIILLSGLPVVAINYFDIHFGFTELLKQNMQNLVSEYKMQAYIWKIILQWTSFVLASITAFLAFTQYKLTNNRLALVIGVAILCAGFMEFMQIVFVGGITQKLADNPNTNAFFWVLNSVITTLALLVGLLLALNYKLKNISNVKLVLLITLIFVSLFSITIYLILNYDVPAMWHANNLFVRPYEGVPLSLNLLLVLVLYPLVYARYPHMLTNGIFYMGIIQISISLYLMLLSNEQYDSAFYIAYSLKIVFYFIPFSCLIMGYVFSYETVLDIKSKLKDSNERLQYLATHDYLTDLYNRRHFEDVLNKIIVNKTSHSFALFIIDIDKFKYINDTFGHFHGDIVLKKISAKLKCLVRHDDLLFRIGGDEFALIMLDIESNMEAHDLADRIVNHLNIAFSMKNKIITTTVSVGVSIFPQDEVIAENLFKLTDHALYHAKHSGRNDFKLYSKHHSVTKNRTEMIADELHLALNKGELYLLYQPKFNLITKKITSAEVLLRWKNTKLGLVLPDEFIPIAESTGLIIQIGQWVLEKTCSQIKALSAYKVPLAVNISPVQLNKNTNFYKSLQEAITKNKIKPKSLEVEITENFFMRHNIKNIELMENIKKLGVLISIDDFGMGYSSLSRLKTLPIDSIKIDKFFVAGLDEEHSETALVDIIISLANQLGVGVVAEGIETQNQLDYLISQNCESGQGFYFSRPVNIEQFKKLLDENIK